MDGNNLTLPGDLPGLLRRGSPLHDGAVVVSLDGDGAVTCRDEVSDASGVYHNVRGEWLPDVRLDLTDATGRAHAAWWLARACGEPQPELCVWTTWVAGWELAASGAGYAGQWLHKIEVDEDGLVVGPVLAALDPDDSRTLPDGSRWVDAEALRRVCLHVAGREVT